MNQKKWSQHFLKDKNIAKKIVKYLTFEKYKTVVEVGPGTGMLTKELLKIISNNLFLIEIDKELSFFLRNIFSISKHRIINKDFLKWNPDENQLKNFALIGNFPYGISTKILLHIIKYSHYIPECIGMFQKEFVTKIMSHKGKKLYGISSVLTQTFYDIKYLFTVKKNVFYPIPKIHSSVIFLRRKENQLFSFYQKKLFFKCVKMAFNQRRKKIKNSLKSLKYILNIENDSFILNKRAEELSFKDFIQITKKIPVKHD
ncbi:16S rRNA (adenine(1518)-N(6)/adenine(1519)-N(6))-dimethyltransferase RsmA [Blattabacterium cuenoti]|uniref:16S rRNA (adenine(1518)-N(6)/adenine(1519)-N(6))- dimethyltransferase RsmA n=1 Tax=Blattabacterium cuenoti TaxID=1653831 RepID=UPI00163D27B8|nr:16S rRNA (adenine(1518)-N(6)/adenine(1519)-N(6))-dimethyltransferase RsmA [Blattabacterium cuenoti]